MPVPYISILHIPLSNCHLRPAKKSDINRFKRPVGRDRVGVGGHDRKSNVGRHKKKKRKKKKREDSKVESNDSPGIPDRGWGGVGGGGDYRHPRPPFEVNSIMLPAVSPAQF